MASAVQSPVGGTPALWDRLNEGVVGTVRLFYMSVWRNWLSLKQYKANFIFSLTTGALFGAGMLLFALVFDLELLERTVGTTNYVSFAVLGFGYQAWQGVALGAASEIFRNELSTGQIDYTFTCPFSRYGYIVSNVAALAVQESVFFVPMLVVGLWFTRQTLTRRPGARPAGQRRSRWVCWCSWGLLCGLDASVPTDHGGLWLLSVCLQMLSGMYVPVRPCRPLCAPSG